MKRKYSTLTLRRKKCKLRDLNLSLIACNTFFLSLLIIQVTAEGDIWMNYAKLCSSEIGGRQPDLDKSLQYLQVGQY